MEKEDILSKEREIIASYFEGIANNLKNDGCPPSITLNLMFQANIIRQNKYPRIFYTCKTCDTPCYGICEANGTCKWKNFDEYERCKT